MGESFRTISELAERCGHYCWVERRLFELTGQWASGTGEPECRVFFSTASSQHAALAGQWHERLPVRAGVDRGELALAPPGPLEGALELLAGQPDHVLRLGGLVTVVLPQLLAAYDEDLARASAVREAPVMAVLRYARLVGSTERSCGQPLLERGLEEGDRARKWEEFAPDLERLFGGPTGIFPGARAS